MNNKLIITKRNQQIISCLLEDNKASYIHCYTDATSIVGNIYIGKVQTIVKNIEAAFIEIENGFPCYLPLSDCKNPILCNREYQGKLVQGDEILIQVIRDRIKTKEPVVTTNLSFSGRYSVISTGNTHIGYSKNLSKEEKNKLKVMITPYMNKNFGYIMRTNATNVLNGKEEILIEEIQNLTEKSNYILSIAKTRTVFSCLYETLPEYILEVRDIKINTLNTILTDDPTLYQQLELFMKKQLLIKETTLTLYNDSTYSLHKLIELEKIIANAITKKIWLKSGGYLVIEPTEALTVVDVNTGKYTSKKSLKETFYKINIEAAKETARQMKLRNLSGIIIVDFINMEDSNNNQQLLEILREECSKDAIKTVVVDITPLGLVEITRKRIHPPLEEQLQGLVKI